MPEGSWAKCGQGLGEELEGRESKRTFINFLEERKALPNMG